MKVLFFLISLLYSISITAQLINLPYNREHYYQLENSINATGKSFHSAIKPYNILEVKEVLGDTVPLYKDYFKDKFGLQPVLDFSGGFELNKSEPSIKGSAGLRTWYSYKNKLSLDLTFYTATSNQPFYIDSAIRPTNVMVNENLTQNGPLDHTWNVLTFNANYKPSKYFQFQAGQGKYFIGEGYRSLLLSDVAPVFPYFAIHTNVWKFRYLNLYTMMKDYKLDPSGNLIQTPKFTTIHYLSWNVHRNINLSFFEAVVYQNRDSSTSFAIEPNYLNPVIFYRPVEYSIGSADNALLGGSLKFRLFKSHILYGQLMLDEFLLSELKAKRGWWGNKFAWQAGYKYYNVFGIKGLTFLAEYNYIRPYTYSHGNITQNYGHKLHSLAHPAGSNFTEVNAIASYSRASWLIESKTSHIDGAIDPAGKNFGNNIFQSYKTREEDFGNYLGQGIKRVLLYNQTKVSYLAGKWGLIAEAGVETRLISSPSILAGENSILIFAGVRTAIFNSYRDF